MSSADAVLALARWQNALIAAAGVLLGAWWAGWGAWGPVLAAACAAIAFTAAANAWNDIADRDIDRIAHPTRPLPSGALDVRTARFVAWGAAATGLVLATIARPALGLVSGGVLVVMWGYSPLLKRHGLVGNAAVAILASLPFLYGAWAVGRPRAALILVAVAAPLHFARELAKDIDDAAGDALMRRTVPVVNPTAARIFLFAALALFALMLAPLIVGRPRFAAVLVPALVLCALAARAVLRGRTGAPALFKLAMLCAMVAFAAARG